MTIYLFFLFCPSSYFLSFLSVPVSAPVIHTVGKVIIGQPFMLQCESDHGTLPITYTLLKFQEPVASITVTGPQRSALFNISSISNRNESHSFICLAENQEKLHSKSSLPLKAPVIGKRVNNAKANLIYTYTVLEITIFLYMYMNTLFWNDEIMCFKGIQMHVAQGSWDSTATKKNYRFLMFFLMWV